MAVSTSGQVTYIKVNDNKEAEAYKERCSELVEERNRLKTSIETLVQRTAHEQKEVTQQLQTQALALQEEEKRIEEQDRIISELRQQVILVNQELNQTLAANKAYFETIIASQKQTIIGLTRDLDALQNQTNKKKEIQTRIVEVKG